MRITVPRSDRDKLERDDFRLVARVDGIASTFRGHEELENFADGEASCAMVRAAAFWRKCLSLAKARSIGFGSGE